MFAGVFEHPLTGKPELYIYLLKGGISMPFGSIIMIVLFFAFFWFVIIRPQQKRQKQTREMQENLTKGDRIITIGGLHGTIDAIDEGNVIIQCNDKGKLTYDRAAIREVVNEGSE
jgi:preprotein translocase subunit YajC